MRRRPLGLVELAFGKPLAPAAHLPAGLCLEGVCPSLQRVRQHIAAARCLSHGPSGNVRLAAMLVWLRSPAQERPRTRQPAVRRAHDRDKLQWRRQALEANPPPPVWCACFVAAAVAVAVAVVACGRALGHIGAAQLPSPAIPETLLWGLCLHTQAAY
jgi:hypothetical protein